MFAINSTDLLIGWGGWRRTSRAQDCSIFAPDFYMTEKHPWLTPQHFEVIQREHFTPHLFAKMASDVKPNRQGFQWVEPSREGFEQQVQKIRKHFEQGRLEKAVPVVHAQAREIMTQDRLLAIVEKMSQAPVSLIPQGFWDFEAGEGLLGATPERLFSIDAQGVLATMALAGTRAKTMTKTMTGEPSEDSRLLFEDTKERHEHQLVVDDLAQRLGPFGRVQVGETFVAELPTLLHLKTSIVVDGVASDFETLARTLHPTPALGVAPRAFDFQKMREWDDTALRVRYGAPFGLVLKSHQIQDCLVAIRNIQWSNGEAPTLGSGCGFVKQSETDREWAELKLKRDSVKKVLGV